MNLIKILTLSMLFVFVLSGCNKQAQENNLTPVITTTEFDITLATEIVKQIEQPLLDLSFKSSVSRAELGEIQKHSDFLQKTESIMRLGFIDGADWNDTDKQELDLIKENFFPTVFHKDIEVTNAYIETVIYNEEYSYFNSETLYIEEQYMGNVEIMDSFLRKYHLSNNANDEWIVIDMSGRSNYGGKEYSSSTLPLK